MTVWECQELGRGGCAAFFLLKSVYHTRGGRWRLPGQAEAGVVAGFISMLLIPVALGVAFLGAAAGG